MDDGASVKYRRLSENSENRIINAPETVDYQQIMSEATGEFGFAHKMIVIAIGASTMTLGFSMLMLSYVIAEPDWWLKEHFINHTDNKTYDMRTFKKCPVNTNNSSIVFQEGMDTIVSEWHLICGKAYVPTAVSTIQMIGLLVGSAPVGQLAGMFGRNKIFMSLYVLNIVGLVVIGFSVNWYILAVTMFFIGISIGGFLSISKVFLLEFITTRKRTVVGVIPFWAFSLCILAGLMKIIPNWKHLYFTCAASGLPPLFLLWFFLPESIRWLLTKGKREEANTIITTLARRNKLPEPDSSLLDAIYGNNEKDEKKFHAYKLLFKHKFSRWKIFIFAFFWFTCSYVMYALTLGVGLLSGDMALNMLFMGAGEIVNSLLVWMFAKCFGRKNSNFSGITRYYTSILLTKFQFQDDHDRVSAPFTVVAWSEAYAFVSACARVGGILAPQNRTLYDISVHLPFTVNGILTLISAGLCFFLQDTYSKPMSDHYDNEESSKPEQTRTNH